MVLLTGTSFPLVLLYTRIEFPDKLISVVYFQSIVVFFTFLMQLGLRAGGRIHLHLGRQKTVDIATIYLVKNSWKLGVCLTLLSIFLRIDFFPSFIITQALLSYLQGIYVAKKDKNMIIINSATIFISIIIASSSIIFIQSSIVSQSVIELLSLLLLIYMSISITDIYRSNRGRKLFLLLINKYKGLQYSSYFIYLSAFLLSQIFVVLGGYNQSIITIYTDVILVCGLQVLVIGKLSVFIEGKVIKEKSYRRYISIYLIWCMLSSLTLSFLYNQIFSLDSYSFVLLLSLVLLGKIAFSFCSQYINKEFRNYIYKLGGIAVLVYGFIYLLIFTNEDLVNIDIVLFLLTAFSGFILTLILLCLEKIKNKDIFI